MIYGRIAKWKMVVVGFNVEWCGTGDHVKNNPTKERVDDLERNKFSKFPIYLKTQETKEAVKIRKTRRNLI